MDKYETRRTRLLEAISLYCGGKQSELARKVGISDSYVARMLYPDGREGKKRIGEDMVDRIAWALGIERSWFDREPSDESPPMYAPTKLALVTKISPIEVDEMLAATDSVGMDVIYLQESRLAPAVAQGRSEALEFGGKDSPYIYQRSWFTNRGISPSSVRRLRVSDDGMTPMIYPGDAVLVNLDETTVSDGKLYAIRYREELRVRYLSRMLNGNLILRALNPAYKDEEVVPEMAAEHIAIIGRVRDRTGGGGM